MHDQPFHQADGVIDVPEDLRALVGALRRGEDLGPAVDAAVLTAVRAAPAPLRVVVGGAPTPAWALAHPVAREAARPARSTRNDGHLRRAWRFIAEPRAVRVSPLGALMAAGLAIAAVFGLKRDAGRTRQQERLASGTGEFPTVTGEYAAVQRSAERTAEHRIVEAGSSARNASGTPLPAGEAVTRFMLVAPTAAEVAVVGDFNDWDSGATPLVKVAGQGVWTVEVPLRPGRYSYAFLVDGQRWIADPAAPRAVGDDFGRPSSVVTVRPLGGQV